MGEIQIPNYIHYSRMKTISADEAQWLLANFELRDKNISDPDEYERLLENQMKAACKVLWGAFDGTDKDLPYIELGEARFFDNVHQEYCYAFSRMQIQMADFCSWALKLNYDLPEELATLAIDFGGKDAVKNQGAEDHNGKTAEPSGKTKPETDKENTKVIDGLLIMVIAMARDCYGYDPKNKKSTTTADIRAAIDKCGLSLSENTIRTRLKEAAALLPREEKTQ